MTLREFYVKQRFSADLADLEKALKDSASGRPRLVVVDLHKKIPSTQWGRGAGMTPLLEAFVDRAPEVAKCRMILDFTDVRKLSDQKRANFFESRFIEKVLKKEEGWRGSLRCYGRSTAKRLKILISSWVGLVGGLIASLLTISAALVTALSRPPSNLSDPGGQSKLDNILQILTPYQSWLWLASLGILVLTLVYCLLKLDVESTQWTGSAPQALLKRVREERRSQLLQARDEPDDFSPKDLLRSLSPRKLLSPKKCLLLVIDDVDCIDGESVRLILDLFEAAEEIGSKHRVCVMLGYNPSNPNDLGTPEKEHIHYRLYKGGGSRVFVHLTRPELDELTYLLCDCFENNAPERLIGFITGRYPEVSTRQLLGFFEDFDARLLETIEEGELLERFDLYIRLDEIEVEKIISKIKDRNGERGLDGGSLKLLKFMLASRSDRVPTKVLEKLLEKQNFDLSSYGDVLKEVRLIEEVPEDHGWYYRFREDHWRYRISTSWNEWTKSVETEHCTKLFDSLCEDESLPRKERYNPEQALKRGPSEKAVEVLCNEGLYYYKYYGHSDAGYALRFLGREEGGALTKWQSLCKTQDDAELWKLLYWEHKTVQSPYRGLGTSQRMPDFSAPRLVLDAATAYWVTGHIDAACEIIEFWKSIRIRISGSDPPKKYEDDFWGADAEIFLLLAKIRLHRGKREDWTEAEELCRRYTHYSRYRQAALEANFIIANIRHYRRFATGRWLPPLQFEPDDEAVEDLLKVAADEKDDDLTHDLVRLRAFYSVSSGMWDSCFEKPIDPLKVIDPGISGKNVYSQDQLDCLRQTIENAVTLLGKFSSLEAPQPRRARQQTAPPGGRAAQAEVLFWKAVFLYQKCLLLATDVGLAFRQKRAELDHGEQDDRLQAHALLAELCEEFANCSLLINDKRDQLMSMIREDKKWIQDQLRNPSSDVDFPTVRTMVNRLYSDLFNEAIRQADRYFADADTVYRRLGHQQGRAEVVFQRGLMLLLTKVEPDGTTWQELLANSNQVSGELLGFHLDHLYSRIAIARAAQDSKPSNPFDARSAYQSAIRVCSDLDSDISELVVGELSYRLGLLLHNQRKYLEATTNDALEEMKKARDNYHPYYPDGDFFVTGEEVSGRMMTIRCSLAELRKREAGELTRYSEPWTESLDLAETDCKWVIRRTKDRTQFKPLYMQARLIKAEVSLIKRAFETAIREYDSLIEYIERQGEPFRFLLLQTTLSMFMAYKEAPFEEVSDSEFTNRLTRVNDEANAFKEILNRDDYSHTLGDPEKGLLLEACLLLGKEYREIGQPDSAREWYFEAFSTYVSLGRPGQAILLDDEIREVLPAHEDHESREYIESLRRASEQIDGEREKIDDWKLVYKILRDYFPVRVPAETPHLSEKRDCLRSGFVSMEEEDFEEAISWFERGKGRIVLEHPEDVDFELLEKLRVAYRKTQRRDKVPELDSLVRDLKDVDQSCSFLRLAETYLHNGWDAWWALKIATDVKKKDSSCYTQAEQMLERLDLGRE